MGDEALDLRGLSCPEPSERTLKALRAGAPAELRVLVDDPAAREHLERLGARLGYAVASTRHRLHDEVVLRRVGA